jgi:hypothetical protein
MGKNAFGRDIKMIRKEIGHEYLCIDMENKRPEKMNIKLFRVKIDRLKDPIYY